MQGAKSATLVGDPFTESHAKAQRRKARSWSRVTTDGTALPIGRNQTMKQEDAEDAEFRRDAVRRSSLRPLRTPV